MKLGQLVTVAVVTMMLVIGSHAPILPVRADLHPHAELMQLSPSTIAGQLNENSQTLDDISYFNIHSFAGNAGDRVYIELVSEEFDAYLILLGPEDKKITEDDDSGGATHARLVLTLPSTGTYQVLTTSYDAGATGRYTLDWRPATTADIAEYEAIQAAAALNQQVNQLYQEGRYGEAIPPAEEMLTLRRDQLSDRPLEIASSLNTLAQLYKLQGRYEEAESLYQQALAIYQEQWEEHHPDVATGLNNLANLYSDQGRYEEAESFYLQSLEINREELGAHPIVATGLNNLATLYDNQGRYREAESLYLEALEIYREQSWERPTEVAFSLNNLAALYDDQGRYDEAESLYLQSLEINRERFGERHPAVATGLNNLALIYQQQGRYTEAESLYLQAQAIFQEQLHDRHPNVATLLENRANLYSDQGRYEEAESLYLEALEINREQLGARHPDTAISLNNLATLYIDQDRTPEAEPLYQEVLAIYREQLDDRHPLIATSLNNLATLYRDQSRYGEAESLYRQALALRREQLGDRHPDTAVSLHNLALIYSDQGRYEEAESLYQQALAIYDEQLGATHPTVAIGRRNFALMHYGRGSTDEAIADLQIGLEVEERNLDLNLATLTEAQRQAYTATIASTVDFALHLHLQAAPDNPDAAHLALTTLLRRKGRLLDAGISSFQALRQNLTSEDQIVLDNLAAVRQELATLTFNPPANISPNQYQSRLTQLETETTDLEKTLAERSATFRIETQPVTIATVQTQIPAKSVLVEYVRYRPVDVTAIGSSDNRLGDARYAAYLLFPDGRIEAVDLGDAATIDAAVKDFSSLLRSPSTNLQIISFEEAETSRETAIAATITTLIFDPIAPYLADREHLLIAPDSQLNRIPFEALQTEPEGRYLVERYQISYLNSGRDLLKLNLAEPSTAPALLLANPDYDIADSNVSAIPLTQTGVTPLNNTRSLGSDRRSIELGALQFGPLPGTAIEAEAIAPLLPNANILTEGQATENVLKTVAAPRILHIATHGFFLANVEPANRNSRGLGIELNDTSLSNASPRGVVIENPLLRSGLALAGFNARSSGREDGLLTALEASSLNLFGTQLVVLSACETGLGDIANGEGVYGLRRSFAIAGAATQLMSLWLVSDDGTQVLMARYYEKLMGGMGRSEALRATQLEMLNEQGQYSHPYYWASFILAGDWQTLE